MNWQNIVAQQLAENLGWTLVHSLWQISLIAFLLFVSLRILKNASANLRYVFSVAALFLTVIITATTFISFVPSRETKESSFSAQVDAAAPNNSSPETGGNNALVKVSTDFSNAETTNKNRAPTVGESLTNRAENLIVATVPYVIWFWLFGVLCFSFRFCGGMRQVSELRKGGGGIGEDWQVKCNKLCEKTGVRRTVNFLQSEIVKTPMVIGWLKPLIIVPSSVLLNLNPSELETIIAHELVHIRRHDYLINILQSLVEILLFFHPLTWWISAQIRRERENVCDDEVLKIFNGESLIYASALANLEDFRSKGLTPLNVVAANGGNLRMRIQRIIKRSVKNNHTKESFRSILPVFLFFAAFLSGVLLTGWWYLSGENKESVGDSHTNKIAVGLYSGSIVLLSENSAEEDAQIMRIIISKLKQHNIPTTGFLKDLDVNFQTETNSPAQEQTLNLWRTAKFEIGFSDLKFPQSYNSTTDEYRKALKNKENKLDPLRKKLPLIIKEIKKLKTQKSSKPGMSAAVKFPEGYLEELEKAVKEWKQENNLINVKYTLGADDWMYSFAYDFARKNNDQAMMELIKVRYIDYMSKTLEHYEYYARQIFGRDIPQTLPLAPSRLLADSADELFTMIENHNYEFVSLDEAMRDEIYQSEPNYFNQVGGSWLISTALKRNMQHLNKLDVDADTAKIWKENQPSYINVIGK